MVLFRVHIEDKTIQQQDADGHVYPTRKYESEEKFNAALKQIKEFTQKDKDYSSITYIGGF